MPVQKSFRSTETAHEARFLQRLKDKGIGVAEITGRGDSAELATIAAMQAGQQVIFQAALSCGEFAGRADFLYKVDGASDLGDYHYEAWDTKLAKKAKPYFAMQLCCYSEMLEHMHGRLPAHFKIVLGDLTEKVFRTSEFINYYRQLKKSFLEFQANFSKDKPPESCIAGTFSPWKTESEKMLEERDHLSRVANIRKMQIQRLKKVGITTMHQLAEAGEIVVPKMNAEIFTIHKRQAQLQLQTAAAGETAYEPLPLKEGKGLGLLPPASDNDVYFDMEGYPHVDEGLEYLFGVVIRTKAAMEFKDWWAHDRGAEQKAFEQFIDWVYARWLSDHSMHIYHYADYEVSAMRRLVGRFNTRIEEVDALLRNEVFVDLYRIVRQSLLIGEPSYSIKKVEHLYRGKRKGEVATAMESVVFYELWLETNDGNTWQDSKILKEIRDYNEQDCVSTLELADWLRRRQKKLGVSYTGKTADPTWATKPPTENALLAAKLLEEAAQIDDPQMKQIQKLLAYFLEFHTREDKPKWWKIFDRQKATDDELFEDLYCLASLTCTRDQPRIPKKSTIYEYRFDPAQDTKIDAGDHCFLLHDLGQVTVKSIDREKGLIELIVGPSKPTPPSQVSITLNDILPTDTIADSIYRVASQWRTDGLLPSALADLLNRREPRIRGVGAGESISASAKVDDIKRTISNMIDTSVIIQGPPGSGKTYTGSHTIIDLIKQGKRVGITSNSHKAIENLLEAVIKVSVEQGVSLKAAKVGGHEYVHGQSAAC